MSEGTKLLRRSRHNRMIGGVCAGLGEYLTIDPTVIRLLFLLMLLFGGPGAGIVYLAFLFVVPEEPLPSQSS